LQQQQQRQQQRQEARRPGSEERNESQVRSILERHEPSLVLALNGHLATDLVAQPTKSSKEHSHTQPHIITQAAAERERDEAHVRPSGSSTLTGFLSATGSALGEPEVEAAA